MLSKQIEYYNQLPEDKKWIVNISALIASNINLHSIYYHNNLRKGITQKLVKETIDECIKYEIFLQPKIFFHYEINIDFLIYIMPFLEGYKKEKENISGYGYTTFFYNAPKTLSSYLYSLFFEQNKIVEYEKQLLRQENKYIFSHFWIIFEQKEYNQVLHLINNDILVNAINLRVNFKILDLHPIDDIIDDSYKKYNNINFFKEYMRGNFIETIKHIEETNEFTSLFMEAINIFCKENNASKSLVLFEKGLKKQRAVLSGSQLPTDPMTAFYYIMALLNQEPKQYSPVLAKIIHTLEKKKITSFDQYFLSICTYTLKSSKSIIQLISDFKILLTSQSEQYHSLFSLIALHFANEKLTEKETEIAYTITSKAYQNGYWLLALEAAYAVDKYMDDDRSQKLYSEIKEKLGFDAMLSRVSKQEDWEKSLNLLLGLVGGDKAAFTNKQSKVENRVIYEINFKYNTIQPILQKWQPKTNTWTTGRNIALKTFYEKMVEGMTEQDHRIAQCLRRNSGYYGKDELEFKDTVFKELVGHPYLFLAGAHNIPIELLAGEPILEVSKIGKNYRISGNVKNLNDSVVIQKETNTRYQIFMLTDKQRHIFKTIKNDNILIPEKGKEKLSEILSFFTSQFTIHSDLVQSQSQTLKTVETDSRIRVQLLPFGNGLKAELFAKPFGTHPPYCKPGVGGKVLIHNQHGEQLQVTRDLKKETEYANILLEDIQSLENIQTEDNLIAFDEPEDALFLLNVLEKYQDIAVVEWPEGERYRIKKNINFENIKLSIKGVNNWFELQGEVEIDEKTVLSIQQLIAMSASSKNRFVELKNGEFLSLSTQLKKQLDELNSFSQTGKKGLQINKFASASMEDFFSEFDHIKTDKAWKDFQNKISKAQTKTFEIPIGLETELRPYQEEGFRWMARLAEWEAGACLADDMGLGKTIQSLALLLHRASLGAALVVAPVSVIPNWISEINKFAPSLRIKTLNNNNRKNTVESVETGDVLVVSYGLLQSETDLLNKITWASLVLDEAHTIKNYNTKTSKAAMTMNASFKLALTGTPIQNHLGEIWNLFNFLNPGLLGNLSDFTGKFINTGDESAKKNLKNLVMPFILRRNKTSVLDELPPKTEIIKKIQLSAEESAFYEALRRQAVFNMENDDSNSGAKHIKALAEITRLRQASCNTALVNPETKIPSTKLSVFMEIVSELKENNHRALVFSQFVSHLALVKKELDAKKIKYQYLDGSTPLPERERCVKRFQSGETDLFLISLKAGGLGLNLTAADFVIHLDPWWNPAIEDQASDRAHRIGQSRPVTVYRLVSENTIEEKIIELHNTKRDLADTLLEGSDQSGKLSTKELLELIKNM